MTNMMKLMEEYAVDMIPFAEDDYLIVEAEKIVADYRLYFVKARTDDGAYFLSEYFEEDDIKDYRKEYADMIRYFGGGVVEIWEVSYYDIEPIITDRI